MSAARVLLAAADNFFRCHWCGLAHLTQTGRDAHESVCARNPKNQK